MKKPLTPLTYVLLPLPRQTVSMVVFLSLGQCQGPLKTLPPVLCLRQDIPLVSAQISKSWFHLSQQTEWFKAVLDMLFFPYDPCVWFWLHSQTETVQEALIKLLVSTGGTSGDGLHHSMLRVCPCEHPPCWRLLPPQQLVHSCPQVHTGGLGAVLCSAGQCWGCCSKTCPSVLGSVIGCCPVTLIQNRCISCSSKIKMVRGSYILVVLHGA